MSNEWETGICGCCDVKDCGVGCCVKLYCVRPRVPRTMQHKPACRDRNHALQLPLHSRFQPPALCLVLTVCYMCAAMCSQGECCIWGAAMEKAGHGSCCGCCLGLYCCLPCTLCQVRDEMG